MNLTQLMESYICLIADYKPKVFQKIDVVIMNQNAALISKSIILIQEVLSLKNLAKCPEPSLPMIQIKH